MIVIVQLSIMTTMRFFKMLVFKFLVIKEIDFFRLKVLWYGNICNL